MRLSEIIRLEGNALREAIESENTTGVSTDDLVRIVNAHREDQWKSFDSVESLSEYLDQLTTAATAEKDNRGEDQ